MDHSSASVWSSLSGESSEGRSAREGTQGSAADMSTHKVGTQPAGGNDHRSGRVERALEGEDKGKLRRASDNALVCLLHI